ncbi:hypothetical protein AWENTII_011074 [Aspergillus wentii]
MCESLVQEAGPSIENESTIGGISLPTTEPLLSLSIETEQENAAPLIRQGQPASPLDNATNTISNLRGFPMPLSPGSPLLFDTAASTIVKLSQFVSQLRLACVYHAYFSLRNPSFKLDNLRRKFRFLLSMLSRERLTCYFEATLHARIQPERMTEWEDIPFFSVGGAGTHYLRPSSSNISPLPRRDGVRGSVREDPLSGFPVGVQGEMSGEWFDIRDLEGFLQEKDFALLTHPPTEKQGSLRQAVISASSLIKILVSTCICLGRSPGWRRNDVENAVRIALCT